MKMIFGPSKKPVITEKDTGILRRVFYNNNEECWKTGNYTNGCNCELCLHKDECSGHDKEE